MRLFGTEIKENTPGGLPTAGHLAVVLFPVFLVAWMIGYTLIDWLEIVHLTDAQSRVGYKDVFRWFVGVMVLAVPAAAISFWQNRRC